MENKEPNSDVAKKSVSSSYTKAFEQHNSVVNEAIESLDELNSQILQYIYTPKSLNIKNDNIQNNEDDFSVKNQEALKSSMAVMRRLLLDAQVKFRNMVEDNRKLALNIDGLIQSANGNIHDLRQELDYTNMRLTELAAASSHSNGGIPGHGDQQWNSTPISDADKELSRLREENKKLTLKLKDYMQEIIELKNSKISSQTVCPQPSLSDLKLELLKYQQELLRAKEALQAMKADRKRLKAEKVDLLSQMKQLYSTLEEKESELREFIRNYEQRMNESDNTIKQLALEKEECEREKWQLLKHARDATERTLVMKTEVDDKDFKIRQLVQELSEVKKRLSELQTLNREQKINVSTDSRFSSGPMLPPRHLDAGYSSGDKKLFSQSDASFSSGFIVPHHQSDTGFSSGTDACTPTDEQLPPYTELAPRPKIDISNPSILSQSTTSGLNIVSIENIDPMFQVALRTADNTHERKKRGSLISLTNSFGSLTRAFARARNRRSVAVESADGGSNPSSPRASTLSDDNTQEKITLATEATVIPVTEWKAPHVLAWLEMTLNMPQYGPMCAANIKSGKVLMEMSDSELDTVLKFTSHLHRRKLRLAIEELRHPSNVKYPKSSSIDHTWVCEAFTDDIGLPQYKNVFSEQLIDGRVLNVLSKKDLEKYLDIHRKFHHSSILHGVELLRRVNFDIQVLTQRRADCENFNCDLLVWTNKRIIQWLETINLKEYSHNLLESGVHGALIVLEPSFTAEVMCVALAIPPSKSYLRRHLSQELDSLVKPARSALEVGLTLPSRKKTVTSGGSLSRAFERSFRGGSQDGGGSSGSAQKKRISFRGSLGRAFGRRTKSELASMPEDFFGERRSQSQEDVKIGTAV